MTGDLARRLGEIGEVVTVFADGVIVRERPGSRGADELLMAAAALGLVVVRRRSRAPAAGGPPAPTEHRLVTRPFVIRTARPSDLPALEELEAACWRVPIRASRDELLARIERFPRGQCVVEWDGRIVAAIYSQRIRSADELDRVTSETVGSAHAGDGSVLQLLALNALPEVTPHALGDQLLDFTLERATVMPGVERVVAVTLCRDYVRQVAAVPMAEYIRRRDGRGQLVDPLLRFHEEHGARVERVVEGYRPADRDNLGHGVLVAYDIHEGDAGRAAPASRPAARPDRVWVARILEDAVLAVARGEATEFVETRSFNEMGLDSLDLYGLRAALHRELGVDVEPTVFFRCATPKAILDHLLAETRDVETRHEMTSPRGETGALATSSIEVSSTEIAPPRLDEPIAVVGMACRFPGGADSPDAFWSLLREGRDAVGEVPPGRWDAGDVPGARHGGFLDRVDAMDAAFFRIAPREAASIDPQQRLLLELAWEALEHAGIDPLSLGATPTGVFAGVFTHDYELLQVSRRANDAIDAYFGTGGSHALAAGRLSYFFGFEGPALAINTACSSSLVAVHLACQSLRRGESELALAAGVNLILSPHLSLCFSRAGMLSASGRCRTFDASADGYVRSEGGGVLVLKRLARARRDGDRILAVIRGTAVNQDGASNGLTAPSGVAQETVIRAALSDAGVAPGAVSYVEAHGTGTLLGDPIEVQALANVYGPSRPAGAPLIVGSVKTNIGHTESAAGIAGLIKVVLSLQHRWLPAHLHVREPNPLLSLDTRPIEIPIEGRAWPAPSGPRLAGVSSFGFSGTNAHVLVEEAPPASPAPATEDRPVHVLALSAATPQALTDLAAAYGEHLDRHPDVALGDVCFTAGTGRAHFDHRLAVAVDSAGALRRELAAFARDGAAASPMAAGHAPHSRRPRVAFLFTGQGSQYREMGRELYLTQPGFRRSLDGCAEILARELPRPLLDVLFPAPGADTPLDETAFTQPALFALEFSLAQLWKEWGVEPTAVLGHSVGEYVAACVAGVFGLEDGLRLIAARGRLMQALPGNGAMVAVLAGEDAVRHVMASRAGEVDVAAVNGREHVVISGLRQSVEHVAAELAARGVKTLPLRVSHAFHSPLMVPMLADFERVLSGVMFRAPRLDVVSNLTGRPAQAEIATPAYWLRHAREPVRFLDGMRWLAGAGVEVFLEIGPGPTLLGMGRRGLGDHPATWLASLQPGRPEWRQIAESVAALYTLGAAIDWVAFDRAYVRRRCALPTYPFQRTRHWFETRAAARPLDERERLFSSLELVERLTDDEAARLHERLGKLSSDRRALLDALLDQGQGADASLPARLYDGVARTGASVIVPAPGEAAARHDRLLTYAPFPAVVPGFSWVTFLLAPDESSPDHARLAHDAQLAMREVLFRHVDFAACRRALDIGCGYGSDMIALAARHPHLVVDGYTISAKQAEIARDTIQARGLEGRVGVYHRDSVTDPFPGRYDLAFGFEVVHHIADKDRLFAHLGRHLEDGGLVVLADFVAHVDAAIEDHAGASFFIGRDRWAAVLADHGFEVVDCVDVSPEIANFLTDDDFDAHVARLAALGADETVRRAFRSYHRGGDLLRKGLASYVLLTARKLSGVSPGTLARDNVRALAATIAYASLSPDRWLYRPVWRLQHRDAEAATLVTAAAAASGSWLVLADAGRTGRELAARLAAAGEACTLVTRGAIFERTADGTFRLDPGRREHFDRLLRGVASDRPLRGIVHLWGADPPSAAIADVSAIARRLCAGMLHLTQAVIEHLPAGPPPLWLVTRGAVPCPPDADVAGLEQAPLWGLAQVLDWEHPELRCVRVDLPAYPAEASDADALLAELRAPSVENRVALRDRGRHVERLVPLPAPPVECVDVRADATYLITGGFGDLGLLVAGWLVECGARHLVLVGRRPPGAAASAAIAKLEAAGTRVLSARADVADRAALSAVLADAAGALPPLAGIVHAAGTFDDGVLLQLDAGRFDGVMAPKVDGAWLLHELTRDLALDFFVLFSSIASLLGNPGQANYAAANAFLDALAHRRRALGLPALSVNWGPWGEIGAAARMDGRNRFATRGVDGIPPRVGLELLGRLLSTGVPQAGVAPVRWDAFVQAYPPGSRAPFLNDVVRDIPPRPATSERSGWRDVPPAQRRTWLLEFLRALAGRAIGIDPARVDIDAPLSRMGLDSLMAVEMRHAVQRELGLDVPIIALMRAISVARLAEDIEPRLALAANGTARVGATTATEMVEGEL